MRAPHVWLKDGRSTLDLFGKGFVLLDFSSATTNTSTITNAANDAGVPLEAIKIAEPDVRETYERHFVLVRPDGHVAWRGDRLPDKPREVIDKVRGAAREETKP